MGNCRGTEKDLVKMSDPSNSPGRLPFLPLHPSFPGRLDGPQELDLGHIPSPSSLANGSMSVLGQQISKA